MNLSTFIQVGQIIPKNIISDAIRTLFMAIDSATFSVIALLFEMVFSIVKIDQLSIITDLYEEIQEKAYIIIGIYMIFKVILSLLTYFANPDKMNDKEIGGGKLVTRIVTSLVLLIVVPTIVFPLLDDVQIPLVNTVGKIVTNNVTSMDDNAFLNEGKTAAISLMSTFFYPDSECIAGADVDDFKIDNIFGPVDLVNLPCETSGGTDKSRYMYNYVFGISNIVAVIAAILLIIIAINVAIRAFKLMVLKILAPIPILSYIEPKSAKDGMLASYTKLFMKTYLDLFIQFGVFYLVMLLIGRLYPGTGGFLVTTAEHVVENPISVFSFPFIFIGLLVFAIMAPKFIKKALNIKDSEFGTGIAGMLTTGTLVAGATGSAVSGFATSAAKGGSLLQNVGAGIAGAIGGVTTGARSGFSGGKTDFSKVLSSINDRNARARANSNAGSTLSGRVGTSLMKTFAGQTPYDIDEAEIAKLDAKSANAKQLKEYLIGEGKKKTANLQQSVSVNGVTQNVSLDQINEAINYANSANGDGYVHFADGSAYAVGSSVVNKLLGDLEEGAGTLYAKAVDNGSMSDAGALEAYRKTFADSMNMDVSSLGNLATDISEIKKIEKSSATASYRIKNSNEYQEHKASANAVKK